MERKTKNNCRLRCQQKLYRNGDEYFNELLAFYKGAVVLRDCPEPVRYLSVAEGKELE